MHQTPEAPHVRLMVVGLHTTQYVTAWRTTSMRGGSAQLPRCYVMPSSPTHLTGILLWEVSGVRGQGRGMPCCDRSQGRCRMGCRSACALHHMYKSDFHVCCTLECLVSPPVPTFPRFSLVSPNCICSDAHPHPVPHPPRPLLCPMPHPLLSLASA